jgi:hypothetical protein
MSALGQKQTSAHARVTSALPPKADIRVIAMSALGQIRTFSLRVVAQFETELPPPGNRLIENQSLHASFYGEAVRPESYRGLAERVRRQRATT